MSTPPNPPGTPSGPPSGPPSEPADAPIPGAAKPSLEKTPPVEDAPAPGTPEAEPEQARPSLTKTPPPEPAAPAPAPEEPGPSLTKAPAPEPAPAPAPEEAPQPEPAPAQTPPPPAQAPSAGVFNPWATPEPGAAPPPPVPPAAAWGQPGPAPAAPYAAYPGYPGHPGYPGYPAYQPVPAAPSNGMAVAALVLGLVAVPVALVPFVFWVGALLGMTAVGLGIAAFVRARSGAPHKVMSLFGVALGILGLAACVGGWFVTANFIDRAVDRASRQVTVDPDEDWDEDGEEDWYEGDEDWDEEPLPTPPPGPGMTTPLDFGRTYTYPSGVKVTVEAPRKYTGGSKWIEVGNAVEVPFTITNTSTEPLRVVHAIPEVRDGKGNAGRLVFDGRMPKRVDRLLEPGQTASGSAAYEVPAGTTSISAELSPGVLLPPAKFTGPVR